MVIEAPPPAKTTSKSPIQGVAKASLPGVPKVRVFELPKAPILFDAMKRRLPATRCSDRK